MKQLHSRKEFESESLKKLVHVKNKQMEKQLIPFLPSIFGKSKRYQTCFIFTHLLKINNTLKLIHVHYDLSNMFVAGQMIFLPAPFSYNYPSCSF